MNIVEKAAYLRGLTEGLGIDPATKEGRLWNALNELLADMAHEIEDLQHADLDRADAIEELADELSYLEDLTCGADEEDPGDEPPRGCPGCPGRPFDEEDDDYDDLPEAAEDDEDFDDPAFDGVIYDAVCPVCGQEISFNEEILAEGSIQCPGCGEMLEFDLDGDEEEDEDAGDEPKA